MTISVIIPSYKPQDYLWACLQSLISQTYPKDEFEVVLVLNGCFEPYNTDIQKFIEEKMQGMHINFIHTEVGGVSNARNIGVDAARGEYITFIDDDDLITPNYLSNLLSVSTPTCVGCSNSYAFSENLCNTRENFLTVGYRNCKGTKFSLLRYRNFLSQPWCKLIHKSIIGKIRFPLDLKRSEDSVFCLAISPNVQDMKLASADTIYYQRERHGSAMRTKRPMFDVIKEHLYIEWKYIMVWCKNPSKYNILFVLSRMVACIKNCVYYLKY